jgi:hypothetical protein
MANKGVTGYGTWKKIRKMGDEENDGGKRAGEINAETQSAQRGRDRKGVVAVSSMYHDSR